MSNYGFRNAVDGSYAAITSGTEDVMRFGGAGGDNSGQLAGFRNILINGKLSINQRGVTIAAAAIGTYGPDRWKKVDASNMTQIVEDGNYKYSSVYTLSGIGVTTQQVTSPASGHWAIPSIPITATHVQLELGSIASDRENRLGLEDFLCLRYYQKLSGISVYGYSVTGNTIMCTYTFSAMRATPTLTWLDYGVVANSSTFAFFSTSSTAVGVGCNIYVTGSGGMHGASATADAEIY